MGRRKVVCNILRHALEFGRVSLLPNEWEGEKSFATSGVMHQSLGGEDFPLPIGHEKSRL